MFLQKVVQIKKEEISRKKTLGALKEMEEQISHLPSARDLTEAVAKNRPLALIAEIKRASPSAGLIQEGADIEKMASQYQSGGACAISILTESHFFHGHLSDLRLIKEKISLPLLQKDFIIDPFQIYEGRAAGADAVLLIAAILDREQLKDLVDLARSLHMVPLVEVYDERDVEKTLGLHLPLLGINNRDLNTLEVDLGTTLRLKGKIAPGVSVISESGIKSSLDVRLLKEAGVNGILVGEVLMRAPDPAAKIRELLDL
ncbi:MAG: indole-3-glycerol phosphate synthase TrpC [Deltaproteobacteria bacterium]|nr:indole-3-glycerol phosphate synthase TrpC [Deltaproteobacteria bacterium]